MLFTRERQTMLSESLQALVRNTGLTNVNPGSVLRAIADMMVTELGHTNQILNTNRLMQYVTTASGPYLDLLGEGFFGLIRNAPSEAFATVNDQAVRFYTKDNSPLANHLSDTYIPIDTEISTNDDRIKYRVSLNVPVDNTQTSVFVPVEALEPGNESNVGVGVLTKHNLTSNTIAVNNPRDISSGMTHERDSEYRYRITNAVHTYARANETAIRMAALSVPEVADVIIQNASSGTGTFNLLLMPTGNTVSDHAMQEVRSAVQFVKAQGILESVRQPNYVTAEILAQLSFVKGTPESEKVTIRRNATTAILNYLGSLYLGETLVYNEVIQRVMEVSNNILDMRVLCWIFRGRPQRLINMPLGSFELFIPDPHVSEPVKVI